MTTIESSPITTTFVPAASLSPSSTSFAPAFSPAGGPALYPTTVAADPFNAHDRAVNFNEQKFLAKTQKKEAKRAQKNAKIANKDWAKSEKLYAKAADLSARGKENRAIRKQDKAARFAAAAQVHQTAASIAQQEVQRNNILQGLPGFGRSFVPGRSFMTPTSYTSSIDSFSSYGGGYNSTTTTGPVLVSTTSSGTPGYIYYNAPTSNDISFADLKHILAKYTTVLPKGALGRLFEIVDKDTKGRISQATLTTIDNDLSSLVEDFRRIDVNNNNTLSRKELREYYTRLGFEKKSVIDALFRYADEDESETVGFDEYVHLALCLLVLRLLFNLEDKDNSGQLSKEEMRKVLLDTALADAVSKKFDNMFAFVDSDNSGTLNYYEFVRLVLLIVD